MPTHFHANGKLLLTGEYFVLDGALALALPTRQGQRLTFRSSPGKPSLHWQSLDPDGNPWFEGQFELPSGRYRKGTDQQVGRRLQQLLDLAKQQNPDFLNEQLSLRVQTYLEFPPDWGFGSSSTLLHLLGQWAEVDPYFLLRKSFGGSGYDLAAAGADGPVFYQIGPPPLFWPSAFHPPFTDQLYFVYLGRKQDSREGIARYRERKGKNAKVIEEISGISRQLPHIQTLSAFEELLRRHEQLVGEALGLPNAREIHFRDYWGAVKSLGAWGGDFVLVSSEQEEKKTREYFRRRGYGVVLNYTETILNKQ